MTVERIVSKKAIRKIGRPENIPHASGDILIPLRDKLSKQVECELNEKGTSEEFKGIFIKYTQLKLGQRNNRFESEEFKTCKSLEIYFRNIFGREGSRRVFRAWSRLLGGVYIDIDE